MQGRCWSGCHGCLGTHWDWAMGARHPSWEQFLSWKIADLEITAKNMSVILYFPNFGTRPAQTLITPLNCIPPMEFFITLGGYIFLGQMVSVGNYRGMVSSRDKIFYAGPSTHTQGYGKFVIACYACFTNSNAKLWLCLSYIWIFRPHFVLAKNRPFALVRSSDPT